MNDPSSSYFPHNYSPVPLCLPSEEHPLFRPRDTLPFFTFQFPNLRIIPWPPGNAKQLAACQINLMHLKLTHFSFKILRKKLDSVDWIEKKAGKKKWKYLPNPKSISPHNGRLRSANICEFQVHNEGTYHNWLVVSTPRKNMSQYVWENKKKVPVTTNQISYIILSHENHHPSSNASAAYCALPRYSSQEPTTET